MSKLIKSYNLHMCRVLYVNDSSIKLFKKKKPGTKVSACCAFIWCFLGRLGPRSLI